MSNSSPTDYASMAFGSSSNSIRGFNNTTPMMSSRPRPVRTSSQFSSPRKKASPAIPRAQSQRHPKSQQFWVRTPTKQRHQHQNYSAKTPQRSSQNTVPPPTSPSHVAALTSWVTCYDETSGYEYYYNYSTKESVWELPPGAKLARDTLDDSAPPAEKLETPKKMSVSEMKRLIEERGLSHHDCVTKEDLRKRLDEASNNTTPTQSSNDIPPSTKPTPTHNNSELVKQLQLQLEISRENEHAALQTVAAEVRLEKARCDEIKLEAEEHTAMNAILRKEHAAKMKRHQIEVEEKMSNVAVLSTQGNHKEIEEAESKLQERLQEFETESKVRLENVTREHQDLISNHNNELELQHARFSKSLEEAKQRLEEHLEQSKQSETEMRERLKSIQDKQHEERSKTQKDQESHLEKMLRKNENLLHTKNSLNSELISSREKHEQAMSVLKTNHAENEEILREELIRRHQAELELTTKKHREDIHNAMKELKRRMKKEKKKALADMEATALQSFEEYEVLEAKRFQVRDKASERAMQDAVLRHKTEMQQHENEAEKQRKNLMLVHEKSLNKHISETQEIQNLLQDVTEREKIASRETTSLLERVKLEESECVAFRESYLREAKKRRELHTELVDLRGNIRVLCRVRPMLPFEIEKEGKGNVCIRFPFASTTDDGIVDVEDRKGRNRFEFDAVYRQESTQSEIFQQVNPLVTSALDGFNVCIFAYGQTGSGKTYTMIGDRGGDGKGRGVYSRSFESLFEMSKERQKTMGATYEFQVSLLEIYNETVRDLLADPEAASSKSGLHIVIKQHKKRRSPKRGGGSTSPRASAGRGDGVVVIEDLTIEDVNSIEEMRDAIRRGARARAVGAHCVNERSSRSHLVVTVYVRGRCGDRETNAKLHLIDLAGSERLAKTGASGQLLKEAKFINKSLSALGDVISALSEQKRHVPFRNSKLTFALQDSLSGNSKVLMFVNCSPARSNSSETTCSLRFAARCRKCALGKAKANVK